MVSLWAQKVQRTATKCQHNLPGARAKCTSQVIVLVFKFLAYLSLTERLWVPVITWVWTFSRLFQATVIRSKAFLEFIINQSIYNTGFRFDKSQSTSGATNKFAAYSQIEPRNKAGNFDNRGNNSSLLRFQTTARIRADQ